MIGAGPRLDGPLARAYSPAAMEETAASADDGTEESAEVNAAGTHARPKFNWRYFLLLNAIAAAVTAVLIWVVFEANALEPFWLASAEWFFDHPGVAASLAISPLLMSLLVGWGYAQRARKRKAAAERMAAETKASATEPSAGEASS